MNDGRTQIIVLRHIDRARNTDKFYAVRLTSTTVTAWWGRGEFENAKNPQSHTDVFPSHTAAVIAANDLVDRKNRSGYNRTGYVESPDTDQTLATAQLLTRSAGPVSGRVMSFTLDTQANTGLFAPPPIEDDPEWAAVVNFGAD